MNRDETATDTEPGAENRPNAADSAYLSQISADFRRIFPGIRRFPPHFGTQLAGPRGRSGHDSLKLPAHQDEDVRDRAHVREEAGKNRCPDRDPREARVEGEQVTSG